MDEFELNCINEPLGCYQKALNVSYLTPELTAVDCLWKSTRDTIVAVLRLPSKTFKSSLNHLHDEGGCWVG